jgi:hypothetical protein
MLVLRIGLLRVFVFLGTIVSGKPVRPIVLGETGAALGASHNADFVSGPLIEPFYCSSADADFSQKI